MFNLGRGKKGNLTISSFLLSSSWFLELHLSRGSSIQLGYCYNKGLHSTEKGLGRKGRKKKTSPRSDFLYKILCMPA